MCFAGCESEMVLRRVIFPSREDDTSLDSIADKCPSGFDEVEMEALSEMMSIIFTFEEKI